MVGDVEELRERDQVADKEKKQINKMVSSISVFDCAKQAAIQPQFLDCESHQKSILKFV